METDPLIALEKAARNAKVAQSERRSRCIRIYLTPEEEAQILAKCQSLAASIYCRAKVLGESVARPRKQIPEINRKLYIELSRLSTNLNQMTREMNHAIVNGQELPLTQAYLKQLKAIEQALTANYQELMKLANDYQSNEEKELSHADREGDL